MRLPRCSTTRSPTRRPARESRSRRPRPLSSSTFRCATPVPEYLRPTTAAGAAVRKRRSRAAPVNSKGLGLAVAHTVATAHGGELLMSRREPSGLCATLRLPCHDMVINTPAGRTPSLTIAIKIRKPGGFPAVNADRNWPLYAPGSSSRWAGEHTGVPLQGATVCPRRPTGRDSRGRRALELTAESWRHPGARDSSHRMTEKHLKSRRLDRRGTRCTTSPSTRGDLATSAQHGSS